MAGQPEPITASNIPLGNVIMPPSQEISSQEHVYQFQDDKGGLYEITASSPDQAIEKYKEARKKVTGETWQYVAPNTVPVPGSKAVATPEESPFSKVARKVINTGIGLGSGAAYGGLSGGLPGAAIGGALGGAEGLLRENQDIASPENIMNIAAAIPYMSPAYRAFALTKYPALAQILETTGLSALGSATKNQGLPLKEDIARGALLGSTAGLGTGLVGKFLSRAKLAPSYVNEEVKKFGENIPSNPQQIQKDLLELQGKAAEAQSLYENTGIRKVTPSQIKLSRGLSDTLDKESQKYEDIYDVARRRLNIYKASEKLDELNTEFKVLSEIEHNAKLNSKYVSTDPKWIKHQEKIDKNRQEAKLLEDWYSKTPEGQSGKKIPDLDKSEEEDLVKYFENVGFDRTQARRAAVNERQKLAGMITQRKEYLEAVDNIKSKTGFDYRKMTKDQMAMVRKLAGTSDNSGPRYLVEANIKKPETAYEHINNLRNFFPAGSKEQKAIENATMQEMLVRLRNLGKNESVEDFIYKFGNSSDDEGKKRINEIFKSKDAADNFYLLGKLVKQSADVSPFFRSTASKLRTALTGAAVAGGGYSNYARLSQSPTVMLTSGGIALAMGAYETYASWPKIVNWMTTKGKADKIRPWLLALLTDEKAPGALMVKQEAMTALKKMFDSSSSGSGQRSRMIKIQSENEAEESPNSFGVSP